MSIWKKMKNYLTDLYYWRTERSLVLDENKKLYQAAKRSEEEADKLRAAEAAERNENKTLRNLLKAAEASREEEAQHSKRALESKDEAIDALVNENEQLTKIIDEMSEELLHQRDLNNCLWEDWGKKHTECAIATKKLQDKDDAEYRTWAEHKLLLAALIMTEPEEAAKFHA